MSKVTVTRGEIKIEGDDPTLIASVLRELDKTAMLPEQKSGKNLYTEEQIDGNLLGLEDYIRQQPNFEHCITDLTKFVYGRPISVYAEGEEKTLLNQVARHAWRTRRKIEKEQPEKHWKRKRVKRYGKIVVVSRFITNHNH